MSIALGWSCGEIMKGTEARIKQEVLEDSMNAHPTLRKVIAGLLKQSANSHVASASSSHGKTECTETTEKLTEKKA